MFLFDKQLITGDNNSAPHWHWRESLPRLLKEWSVRGGGGREAEMGVWEGGDSAASKMKRNDEGDTHTFGILAVLWANRFRMRCVLIGIRIKEESACLKLKNERICDHLFEELVLVTHQETNANPGSGSGLMQQREIGSYRCFCSYLRQLVAV